ncbi:HAD hydrolase, family IA [Clostridium thermobutyricum]|uniref:HAD hydrolase, family IA n=1 Tax=Clostridium thermobutyricum TaxID=29372 RepID=N9XXF1_9CLOT|nr:HAD hydrolase-like protein [Clostridium thermobutyricum]ENZ00267.1 HAD hydrolase, family IA [Clostridium thermobutyricum]
MSKSNTFDKNKIKAILFNPERVLNISPTGHWFIAPNFFKYINKNNFNSKEKYQRNLSFPKRIDPEFNESLIIYEKENFEQFNYYYKILRENFPQLEIKFEKIDSINVDYVYNHYKFFNDTFKLFPELSKNYHPKSNSNNCTSLKNIFKKISFKNCFKILNTSSQKNINNINTFHISSIDEYSLSPNEAIFVDDNIKNCDAAKKLGITSFLLCEDYKSYIYNKIKHREYNIIRSLSDIKSILAK